jgi:Holliday junction resolvase YEN1
VQKKRGAELDQFLVGWRKEIREELATNSRGQLGSKQKALSNKISATFPNLRALELYARPITSWSDGFLPPAVDSWIIKLPALPELALYGHRKFGWSALDIAGKFKRLLFTGLYARRLTLVHLTFTSLHIYLTLQ